MNVEADTPQVDLVIAGRSHDVIAPVRSARADHVIAAATFQRVLEVRSQHVDVRCHALEPEIHPRRTGRGVEGDGLQAQKRIDAAVVVEFEQLVQGIYNCAKLQAMELMSIMVWFAASRITRPVIVPETTGV